SGTMRLVYTYEAIGESIMYFSRPDSSEPYRFSFEARNLKLPTPFLPGDKVFFGTQPEVSPQNGVILTAGERLRALYLDGDGYYKIVSLSSSLPDDAYCNLSISPLFSIGYQRKRLPKRENLLNALSKFIAHSTTRGFSVCKAVSEASFYGITAEELMDIIA
ncbi:MAG: hypothetical protein IJD22_00920, partial [Clostridia bacterium]|nr:hypothetical protein [Clostridia bacterium]